MSNELTMTSLRVLVGLLLIAAASCAPTYGGPVGTSGSKLSVYNEEQCEVRLPMIASEASAAEPSVKIERYSRKPDGELWLQIPELLRLESGHLPRRWAIWVDGESLGEAELVWKTSEKYVGSKKPFEDAPAIFVGWETVVDESQGALRLSDVQRRALSEAVRPDGTDARLLLVPDERRLPLPPWANELMGFASGRIYYAWPREAAELLGDPHATCGRWLEKYREHP